MDLISYITNSIKLYGFSEEAYKYINKKVDWVEAYLVHIVLSALYLSINIMVNKFYLLPNSILLVGGGIFGIVIGPFIFGGILHLFFKLVGGKANYTKFLKYFLSINVLGLFISMVYSFIPSAQVTEFYSTLSPMAIITLILSLIMFVYWIVVAVKTFSKLHEISNFRAFLAVFVLPIVAYIILIIILTIFIVLAMTVAM